MSDVISATGINATTMTLDLDNAVLLPVDMQQAFDSAALAAALERRVSMPTALLCSTRGARRADRSSMSAMIRFSPARRSRRARPETHFRPGFEPLEGEPLVTKSVNSAFIGTDLDLRLKRLGAKHVVTFGISTDMCVSTTVRTGSNMGWDMILVPDACDCFDLPGRQWRDRASGRHPARPCRHARLRILRGSSTTAELTNLRAAA